MPKKNHYVLVRVSAPDDMTEAQVRREVRSLINDQCNHSAEEGDIRAAKVSKVPKGWVGDAQYP
jgi:hypothetical protein